MWVRGEKGVMVSREMPSTPYCDLIDQQVKVENQ